MLKIDRVYKTFNGTPALQGITLGLDRGEILCLLGPSGCGKTTLLRVIAGLEQADGGQVLIDGLDIGPVPVHKRGFGFMFQEYALFPHKNVYGNVAFGLRMANLPKDDIEQRVAQALALVGLEGLAQRSAHDLSGGEQQRVALARSLAPRPRLLLLDEPLGSLDRALRERLMNELRQILKSVRLSALYVTHDQSEAFALGDRVSIMHRGRIEQIDRPEVVYDQPASPFVARFLGMSNLLSGQIIDARTGRVQTKLGELHLDRPINAPTHGQITLLLRPQAARLPSQANGQTNSVRGEVIECSFRGAHHRLVLQHDSGIQLAFELKPKIGSLSVGQKISLALDPQAINLLHQENCIDE